MIASSVRPSIGRTLIILGGKSGGHVSLGIGDVIATKSVWRQENLPNRIDGANCYGSAKRDRMSHFLADRGVAWADAHIRFFSDDASDVPMFEWADEAVPVNPSKKLAELPVRRGWPILDWR